MVEDVVKDCYKLWTAGNTITIYYVLYILTMSTVWPPLCTDQRPSHHPLTLSLLLCSLLAESRVKAGVLWICTHSVWLNNPTSDVTGILFLPFF